MSAQTDSASLVNRHQVDPDFLNSIRCFVNELTCLESEIDPSKLPERDDPIHRRMLDAFEASIDACRNYETSHSGDTVAVAEAQKVFRQETDPWFRQSWFSNRARTKPSGFSGDFNMLCKIYGEAIPSSGIGAYIDLLCFDTPLACAVRGRLDMAREFLIDEVGERSASGKPVRILDIASGPCHEYLQWPSTTHVIDVLAMDNDPHAIAYVHDRIIPGISSPSKVDCISYNAFRTRSSEATVKKFGRFDILYSVGLCDYLTDDVLIKLLRAWDETLSDDGVMFVGFKDTRRYDQTIYQWHLDWFFYQRTIQDVFNLYQKAGFDLGSIATSRDQSGIITAFKTRRDASAIRRIDTASEMLVRRPTMRMPARMPISIERNGASMEGFSSVD